MDRLHRSPRRAGTSAKTWRGSRRRSCSRRNCILRAIQKMDTVGVKPLARIGKEMEELRRSVNFEATVEGGISWEPTKLAKRKAGGFFVVNEKEMET